MYLYIKDNEIKDIFCGDIPAKYIDGDIKEVANNLSFPYKNLSAYENDMSIKPLVDLVALGLISLENNQKIADNKIVNKTDLEMYLDGTKEIPTGFKIEKNNLVEMTIDEKHNEGLIGNNEYYDYQIAIYQEYLDSTDWYIIRKMERGIEIPIEVSTKRLNYIERINSIKEMLE